MYHLPSGESWHSSILYVQFHFVVIYSVGFLPWQILFARTMAKNGKKSVVKTGNKL